MNKIDIEKQQHNVTLKNETVVTDSVAYKKELHPCTKYFQILKDKCTSINQKYATSIQKWMKKILITVAILGYFIYFIAILLIESERDKRNYWCEGDGFVIVITTIIILGLLYFKIRKKCIFQNVFATSKASICLQKIFQNRKFKILAYSTAIIAYMAFMWFDARKDPKRLTSAFGIIALVFIACLFSAAPSKIQFKQIIWGLGMQFIFALLILRTNVGRGTFACLGDKFTTFLGFTQVGNAFAFGSISEAGSYVFNILTVVLFFGMAVSVLYYYEILQWIILKLGAFLEATMGTTPCESMVTASNIFLGGAEAALVILPYMPELTKSEFHAIMTSGYATVAGGVLAAYVSFGIKASHLMSASIMSAPAALTMAKIFYPETEHSTTSTKNIQIYKSPEKHVLHAVINGLSTSLLIIANITASMISFFALAAFLNSIADWSCQMLAYEEGTCSFEALLGNILFPFAWLMGVPYEDCGTVGYLLGTRIMLTEFYSYKEIGTLYREGKVSDRAYVISTYAFCGFANITTIGIFLAAFGAMAPERKTDIAGLLLRGMVAGNMASYLTAAVAGTLSIDSSVAMIHFNSTGL